MVLKADCGRQPEAIWDIWDFLAAGIAWNNPIIAIFTTFLISLLTVSGNAMEISSGLPSSTINILMTLVLLAVLCVGRGKKNADI